jgi:hypothetical protein
MAKATIDEMADFLTGEQLRGRREAHPVIVDDPDEIRFSSALVPNDKALAIYDISELALDGLQGAGPDIYTGPLSAEDARYTAECLMGVR